MLMVVDYRNRLINGWRRQTTGRPILFKNFPIAQGLTNRLTLEAPAPSMFFIGVNENTMPKTVAMTTRHRVALSRAMYERMVLPMLPNALARTVARKFETPQQIHLHSG